MARNNTAQSISNLLTKLDDPDPDIRYMQLNDLNSVLSSTGSENLRADTHTAARVIDRLIKSLTDSNGEVQNQALKWYDLCYAPPSTLHRLTRSSIGPLASRTPNDYIAPYIDKISSLTLKDIDVSVPMTALRVMVGALPHPSSSSQEKDVKEAYSAISKVLIPRLVGHVPLSTNNQKSEMPRGLLQQQKDRSYSADAVDVLIEIVRCYGPMIRSEELAALAAALMELLSSPQANGVVKKRALAGIGVIVPYYKPQQLIELVDFIAKQLSVSGLDVNHRRYLISTIGIMARAVPSRIGSHLDVLILPVLSVLSQEELDAAKEDSDEDMESDSEIEELREASLVTVESLLASCPIEMQPYWNATTQAAVRYVKYDPNVVDAEDDEEMSGTQDVQSDDGFTEDPVDDDDEYADLDNDDAFDDVEDLSWKVRRYSAKVLFTIITLSSATDQEGLIKTIAPVLLSRLGKEREDSVRLEVIAATQALVRKASSMSIGKSSSEAEGSFTVPTNTNKRKRKDSNISISDVDLKGLVYSRSSPPFVAPSPPLGPQADLALLVPRIVQAIVKMWKQASVALKQAGILLLKSIAQSRNGALADYLQQLEDPFADALKTSGGSGSASASGSTATAASLQIETLGLISIITETNPSAALMPFVIALIPPVTSLVNDRNYKVAIETLATIEQFAKALTPPRLAVKANQDHAIHIEKLYAVTLVPVNNINADLEVRHRAIQVFGVLISRTSGTKLLSHEARSKALGVLDDRLKNETTRLESARAIGLVAEAATPEDYLGTSWVQEVSVELSNQLRKADRALRASALEALQYLALNPVTASQYGSDTISILQANLMPAIRPDDLNLLTPALVILAKIIPANTQMLADTSVVEALCKLAQAHLEGPPLKAYLLVVKVVGEAGMGQPLMTGLLAVGTKGDAHVLGRAIGTLMVSGGKNLGVSIDVFIGEIGNKDDNSACLALIVLGEIGLRMGASSPFDMSIFSKSLSSKSDKVRLSAAVALGSASSSDIKQYLPAILQGLGTGSSQEYLYLHALKEILLHTENSTSSIMPFTQEIWTKLFVVSAAEDNRATGAECIGRIVLIDPNTYLLELHKSVENEDAVRRGVVISAFRFTLSNSSTAYNAALSRTIVPLLQKMLSDPDLANRRLAITTLSAAIQNKPAFILPELSKLLPVVLADAHIKKELIKNVKIGPFTHQEDSGLDLRKSAYGALYAMVDSPRALPFLPVNAIFDRIVDGISDDHDIRTLSSIMLDRLSDAHPDEAKRRLPALIEQFKKVLEVKPKDNAVKQEIEKINEANSGVIRASLDLRKKFPNSANSAATDTDFAAWQTYLQYIHREFAPLVKSVSAGA